MKALILVDLQNDFFPGGPLAIEQAPEILPAVNFLLGKDFDLILACKDWHPSDHMSFAEIHQKNPGEHIQLQGIDQILWPVHCVQGSFGAEFVSGWDSRKVKKIFHKGTDANIDSYSTFFDNGHLKSTGLEEFLKSQEIDEVYFAGLATDYCVKYSVFDSCHLGFRTFVIADACRGVNLNPNDSDKAFEEMTKAGATLIDSRELFGGKIH